jgi:hypothetical protein
MNYTIKFAKSLSVGVLFLASLAGAQSNEPRLMANVPFDFVVNDVKLPAGEYTFIRTGDHQLLLRNSEGNNLMTVITAVAQRNRVASDSMLRFALVDGNHVLLQIWPENDTAGIELYQANANLEAARQPAIHGIVSGRR